MRLPRLPAKDPELPVIAILLSLPVHLIAKEEKLSAG
jgi:hypothetical protein